MRKSCVGNVVVVAALCVFAVVVGDVARANEKRPAGKVSQLCETANVAADARLQRVCNEWRVKVAELKRIERLLRLAEDVAAFDEKVEQVTELFGTPGARPDRIRECFRKRVCDERAMAQSMADAFAVFQKELMAETVTLYGKVGISRDATAKAFPPMPVTSAPWEKAFSPCIERARVLSQEDWFRFGLVNVASDVVANGIVDLSKSSGVWQPEEGSMEDFLGSLFAQIVVGEVVDQLSDPTETFATQLQTNMASVERELLDGQSGLLSEMRKLTAFHKQSRLQHLGLAAKGGK